MLTLKRWTAPRPTAALISCVLSLLVTAGQARGYVRSTNCHDRDKTTKACKKIGVPLKWMYSSCIYVTINTAGSADIKDGSDLAAVRRSVQNWMTKVGSCSYLKFEIQDNSPTANPKTNDKNENISDNNPTISWEEKNWKFDGDAAAITTVFFVENSDSSQDGRIIDADIELNGVDFVFTTSATNRKTDVDNTVTHELGHVMGLDHPCDDGTRFPVPSDHAGKKIPACSAVYGSSLPAHVTMRETTMYNFAGFGETKKRTPEADDVSAICGIYPTRDDPGECSPVDFDADGCNCKLGDRTRTRDWLSMGLLGLFVLGLVRRRIRRF